MSVPCAGHAARKGAGDIVSVAPPLIEPKLAPIVVTPVVVYFVDRHYAFDLFFFFIAGYAAFGWVPVSRSERRLFYAEYRRWSRALAG